MDRQVLGLELLPRWCWFFCVTWSDLLGALTLLQTVVSAEDFSKYEKMVAPPSKEERTKEREQLLWEEVQSHNTGLRKARNWSCWTDCHAWSGCSKTTDHASRCKREQLEAVEWWSLCLAGFGCGPVGDLWSCAWARRRSRRHVLLLLRNRKTFLTLLQPLDQEMEECVKMRMNWSWQPVRRFAHLDRRNKLGCDQGLHKAATWKTLACVKTCYFGRTMMLSENTGNDLQSGKEIADKLCNMSHEKLLEFVQNCPASMLQKFVSNVSAALALYSGWFQYQQVPVGGASRLRGGNQAKKACNVFKVSVFGSHVGPGSAKTDSFLCPPPTSSHNMCCGRWQVWHRLVPLLFVLLEPGVFCLSPKRFSCLCLVPCPLGVDGGSDLKGWVARWPLFSAFLAGGICPVPE